ncbi:conserved hypothetical protein, partial [Ricinus communis]
PGPPAPEVCGIEIDVQHVGLHQQDDGAGDDQGQAPDQLFAPAICDFYSHFEFPKS